MEEIDLSAGEDITLFTDEEQVSVNKVNLEFSQHSQVKGLRFHFTIFNDIHCYQHTERKHGGKQKFRINLTYLDPKPVRKFKVADSWLFSSAIFAVISFLCIYAGWFSKIELNEKAAIILTALSLTLSLVSLLFALFKTEDRIILYSQYGRSAILELINKNPDQSTFNDFMTQLSQHIISAQTHAGLNIHEKLTCELKELRRLRDETVISAESYEQAKKRIFSNQAFTN